MIPCCWFLFLFRFSQKTLLGLDPVFWLCLVCADFCSSRWLCHLLVPQLSNFCRAYRILSCVHRSYAWSSSILPKSCESIYSRNEVCLEVISCNFLIFTLEMPCRSLNHFWQFFVHFSCSSYLSQFTLSYTLFKWHLTRYYSQCHCQGYWLVSLSDEIVKLQWSHGLCTQLQIESFRFEPSGQLTDTVLCS